MQHGSQNNTGIVKNRPILQALAKQPIVLIDIVVVVFPQNWQLVIPGCSGDKLLVDIGIWWLVICIN